MIIINISEESIAKKEELFAPYDFRGKTDEEVLDDFKKNSLPYLTSRTEQTFPEVKTKNQLSKETKEDGDVYTLTGDKEDCIVLYIHGGAWVWDIQIEHVEFCDRIVDLLGAKVYIPIFPLAPQATYKEGYAMIRKVYDELLSLNKPIILMGDSSGGNIALGLVLGLKDEGKTLPEKIVLLAPGADPTFINDEIKEIEPKDGLLPKAECKECARMWAAGADQKLPCLNPIYGDYKNYPDTMIIVGDCDIAYPDDKKLYKIMCDAGVNVTFVKGEGFWHVFPLSQIPEKEEVLSLIKDFLK